MNKENDKDQQFPQGHFIGMWLGIGIAVFSGLGIPLSIAMGHFAFIGIGPAIGVAIGLAVGQAVENKHRQEGRIRPLTDAEKKTRRTRIASGLAILVLGFLILLLRVV